MAKYRKLKDLKINEVSLVDKAANGRVFSVIKNNKENKDETVESAETAESVEKAAKTDIQIKSDGSIENTVFVINGKQVAPANFYFSFCQYEDEDGEKDGYVNCDMTIISPETDGGFRNMTTMILAQKNTSGDYMAVEKFLKNSGVVYEKDVDYTQLAKSAEILDEYKGVIPTEVEEAVEYIKKVAVLRKNAKNTEKIENVNGAVIQTEEIKETEVIENIEKQDKEKETTMETKDVKKEETATSTTSTATETKEAKDTEKPKETEVAVFEMNEEKVGEIVQEKLKVGIDAILNQVKESVSQVSADFGAKLENLQKEIEKKPETVKEVDEDVELDLSELIRRAIKDELSSKK